MCFYLLILLKTCDSLWDKHLDLFVNNHHAFLKLSLLLVGDVYFSLVEFIFLLRTALLQFSLIQQAQGLAEQTLVGINSFHVKPLTPLSGSMLQLFPL